VELFRRPSVLHNILQKMLQTDTGSNTFRPEHRKSSGITVTSAQLPSPLFSCDSFVELELSADGCSTTAWISRRNPLIIHTYSSPSTFFFFASGSITKREESLHFPPEGGSYTSRRCDGRTKQAGGMFPPTADSDV
jgi:hypothetical protein